MKNNKMHKSDFTDFVEKSMLKGELDKMVQDAEENAESDKAKKDLVEVDLTHQRDT